MSDTRTPASEQGWTSSSGFIIATIGSAIGVGSIWKFPYEVGANGGGAFVLLYVLGLALVVVPLMLAEFAVGRRGQADAATSMEIVAAQESTSTRWGVFGLLGAVTSFLILSFYAVVGGWTLTYAYDTLVHGLPSGADDVSRRFGTVLASPGRMATFQLLFLGLVAMVVIRGVRNGIESAMKVLMPLMALLLGALTVYSLRNGDAAAAFRFLFVPDFDDLTGRAVLDALGLGFFSIGVGLGILLTYAAYSPPGTDLKTVAIASVVADTVISFVAGLAVFPVVFANDLDAGSGPGLVFETLPVAFGAMPAGRLVATAFFALLAVAALGSAISMLEAVVAVLSRRLGWSRHRSVGVATSTCFVAGLATVFSFNDWSDVHPFGWMERYSEATIYDLLDDATSQLMLPAGGLAIAVFTGWVLSDRLLHDELRLTGLPLVGLRWTLRVVAPVTIAAAAAISLFG
ncbi:MAG: sodium-dependent transporter [Acidimicrobiales bacterium]